MATQLYLRATTASEPKPNVKQSATSITQWIASALGGGQDGASTIYPLEMLTTIGSDNAQGIGQSLAEPGALHYAWYKAWISPPLAYDQVIEGTLTFVADFVEGAAAHNLMPRLLGYVWKGNDSGVRGVFLADTNSAVEADLTPATLQTFFNAIALTPVSAQIGDRIVIEVMSYDNNTKTLSYVHACNLDGAAGSNRESYFLFSKDFAFSWTLADNVYVKLTGDDTNAGFSWATAKQTINAGINALNTGGTLHIGFGDYSAQTPITLNKTMDLLCETADIGGGNGTVVLPATYVSPWIWSDKYRYERGLESKQGGSRGELFIYGGQLKLITLNTTWNIRRGYYHNGTSWVEEPKWVNGLTNYWWTTWAIFWKDGLLHALELHDGEAALTGKVWNPSLEAWEAEDTYLNGLLDWSYYRGGDIWFSDDGKMNLITCHANTGQDLAFTWNESLLIWERNTFYEGVAEWHRYTVFKWEGAFRLHGWYDASPDGTPSGYTLTDSGWVWDDVVIDGLPPQLAVAVPSTIEWQGEIVLVIGDSMYYDRNKAYTRPL